jgi:hypothetical protein
MREDTSKKIAEITQACGFDRRTLALHADRVELLVSGPFDRYRMPVYLHSMKEDPDRIVWIPWRWLILAGLLLVAAGVAAGGPWRHGGAAATLAGGAVALGVSQALRIRRMVVWFYRQRGDGPRMRLEPHVFLLPARPSAQEVARFIEVLAATQKRHVSKVREEEGPPVPYTRELQRFAELKEMKVVTEEEFAEVKAKLLNLRPRRIGF